MKKLQYVLAMVLLVLIALNSVQYFVRIDITTTQANSVSPASKNLVEKIEETVYIDYYLSDKLRAIRPETEQIIDLLDEYAAFARGNVLIDVLDPAKEGIVDEVEALGIAPRQIEVTERDATSYAIIYSGIVVRYRSENRILPFVIETATLEYQISSTLHQLIEEDEVVVGILAGRNAFMQGNQDVFGSAQVLYQVLQNEYRVEIVGHNEPIQPAIDTLVILDSPEFGANTAFYVDQFLMQGGSAFFAINGVSVRIDPNSGGYIGTPNTSPIHSLLEHYGVRVGQELILDENNRAVLQTSANRLPQFVPYPHWVVVGNTVNEEHPTTSRFGGFDLFWASPIYVDDVLDPYAETLMNTTDEAWLMQDEFILDPQEEYLFRQNELETKGLYTVSLAYQGPLSYNDSLSIPENSSEENILKTTDSARFIVLSDVDSILDVFRVTNAGYNFDFAMNSITWLGNDEDLLSIRTRNIRPRALDKIQDPQLENTFRWMVRWFNMLVLPLGVALIGVILMIKRRRNTQR